jgi:AmmeMemoRadiSam system protein B
MINDKSLDHPKLRPLVVRRVDQNGQAFAVLEDSLGLAHGPFLMPWDGFSKVVRHFNGENSLSTIQSLVLNETGGYLAIEHLCELVDRLDRSMHLDGPTFASFIRAYRADPIRPPAYAGRAYAGEASALRDQLDRFFQNPHGAGRPSRRSPSNGEGSIRAILGPHIDFHRGGPVYTWSYRELVERSDAEIFVVLGVAHQYCKNRFVLTYKHFDTPLGLARTDSDYVSRIVDRVGERYLDDEPVHRGEHSIEFQAVFLRYLLGDDRPFRIAPILVGSFHDLIRSRIDPMSDPEIARFVGALREVERESGAKVAYIGGIDLGHIGREFGDPDLLDQAALDRLRVFDASMLDRAIAGDAEGWFRVAAEVDNRHRICGLAATYTLLKTIGPAKGRILKYDQAVDSARTCCVSFASVVFEADANA